LDDDVLRAGVSHHHDLFQQLPGKPAVLHLAPGGLLADETPLTQPRHE